MLIGKELGDVSETTLRFFRQLGVEAVGVPWRPGTEVRRSRPLVPPAQLASAGRVPPPPALEEFRAVVERVRSFGFEVVSSSLPLGGPVLMGREGRDDDLATVARYVELAGACGLRVLNYSFTALRASEGYYLREGAGRGGSELRAFDYDRIRDLPPLPDVGRIERDAMWANLEYFLRAIVPVAERAGVRLTAHPNDPPVPTYRGVDQPVRTLDDEKRLVDLVDSPSNCIYFDSGVTTEMGEDAAAAARWFGERDRIGQVHFRNVRVETPYERYTETFVDEGECDMLGVMRALHETGYRGMIDPDHTPGLTGDTTDTWAGWALAIGHIGAWRDAAERGS